MSYLFVFIRAKGNITLYGPPRQDELEWYISAKRNAVDLCFSYDLRSPLPFANKLCYFRVEHYVCGHIKIMNSQMPVENLQTRTSFEISRTGFVSLLFLQYFRNR